MPNERGEDVMEKTTKGQKELILCDLSRRLLFKGIQYLHTDIFISLCLLNSIDDNQIAISQSKIH